MKLLFRSKIKDWRNNTMNTKKNKACEAALAVNKLITKGQGGPVFPILLKRQRNSSDDENSDDEAVASTN